MTIKNWRFALAWTLTCVLGASLVSSPAAAQKPPARPVPVASAGAQHIGVLGAGDSVSVQVYGQPDMNGNVYVGEDGTVSLPLVGSVPVAGLTPIAAGARIEHALKDKRLLVDPHVTVTIVQSHGGRVSVLGEVHTPGRYTIEPDTSILDLLAQAGGTTENSADVLYVTRQDAQGAVSRFPVALNDLRKGGASFVLKGGDSLLVPRAEQYYIDGEVTAPNMYRIEPGMTVRKAIARAGGITQRGSERRVTITRTTKDGSTTIHARPDDQVQADDVIHVKESIF